MNEVWTSINTYEQSYEVSNYGRVRSLDRVDASGKRRIGKMLKLSTDSYGYKVVKLSKEGEAKTVKVHRLVAEAFIPNKENKETVNHINEIKDDNRVKNLEWKTFEENSKYGTAQLRSGLNRRKPVRGVNIATGEVINFDSATSASKYGFGRGNVTSCCNGKLTHHKGYQWSYAS